jgi:hypothetical protein
MQILLVTAAFAPVATAHSERAVALARLFRLAGHRVHVVTLKPLCDTVARDYQPYQFADAVEQVSSGVHFRLKTGRWMRPIRTATNLLAGFPGPFVYEARRMLSFIERHPEMLNSDLVWITTPPHELQLIGHQLALRHGIPYVMDLRDPWGESRRIRWLTPLHRSSALAWYRECLGAASAVITNTPLHFDEVQVTEPSLRDRLYCVPNAYFEADVQSALSELPHHDRSSEYVLLYAGNLYHGHVERALGVLRQATSRVDRRLRIRVVGALAGNNNFEYCGVVPPAQVACEVVAADCLFLHMPRNATAGPVVSLKAYLYARSGKPIVYEGPKNETYSYLQQYSRVVDYADSSSVRQLITGTHSPSTSSSSLVAERDSWEARWPIVQEIIRVVARPTQALGQVHERGSTLDTHRSGVGPEGFGVLKNKFS